jgi:hypothetical protein
LTEELLSAGIVIRGIIGDETAYTINDFPVTSDLGQCLSDVWSRMCTLLLSESEKTLLHAVLRVNEVSRKSKYREAVRRRPEVEGKVNLGH